MQKQKTRLLTIVILNKLLIFQHLFVISGEATQPLPLVNWSCIWRSLGCCTRCFTQKFDCRSMLCSCIKKWLVDGFVCMLTWWLALDYQPTASRYLVAMDSVQLENYKIPLGSQCVHHVDGPLNHISFCQCLHVLHPHPGHQLHISNLTTSGNHYYHHHCYLWAVALGVYLLVKAYLNKCPTSYILQITHVMLNIY